MRRLCLAILLLFATARFEGRGFAQAPNQVTVTIGMVEVSGSAPSGPAAAHRELIEKEIIRTGDSSLAGLAFGDANVTLGERTEVQVLRLTGIPILWLERGSLKLLGTQSGVQISTKFGAFAPAELPFAAQIVNSGSSVAFSVERGSIRTQDLDTASVVFRATPAIDGNASVRTYVTSSHVTIDPPVGLPANVFVAPCNAASMTSAASPAPTTSPAPAPSPTPTPPQTSSPCSGGSASAKPTPKP